MIDALRERISQVLPETPFASAKEKLSWACRELCTEADAWVHDFGPVVYVDGKRGRIMIPRAEPLRVRHLVIEGRKEAPGRLYQQTGPLAVEFFREPDALDYEGEVACRPKVGEFLPDSLLLKWSEVVINGALWQLFLLPHSADGERASYYRTQFLAGVHEAKSNSMLGYGSGGARVKMRPFI